MAPKQSSSKVDTLVKSKNKIRMTAKRLFPLVKPAPRSAYQLYVKEMVANAKAVGEAPKKAIYEYASDWKAVEDRTKWEEMAANDKIRFYKEAEELGYNIDNVGRRGQKDPSSATKACPPFLMFARERAPELRKEKNISYREALSLLGQTWRETLPAEVKQHYIDMSEQEKLKLASSTPSSAEEANE